MPEDKKIEEVINKYQSFFDNSDADIVNTKKGVWIFFRYDERCNNYDCFIRFKTAVDLEHIILGEIAEDANIAMELTAETITYRYDYEDINSSVQESDYYEERISKLIYNLGVVAQHMHLFEVVAEELKGFKKE